MYFIYKSLVVLAVRYQVDKKKYLDLAINKSFPWTLMMILNYIKLTFNGKPSKD